MRYFIALLGVIALVVLVVFLVVRGISGDSSVDRLDLAEYVDSDATVTVTIDGPINADQEHQAVRITVGRTTATIESLAGYKQLVVDTLSYPNTDEGYANFLLAIDKKGFTKGREDPENTDERGFCPEENRYIFEVNENGHSLQRFWKTSCKEGTFKGDTSDVLSLFRKQIPDYNKFTREIDL